MSCPKMSTPEQAKYHAHFDCFSGVAGDMMLAACLDAADDPQQLLDYIVNALRSGLPALADEFAVSFKRVQRGCGSISGLHVSVESIYQHSAAPVPQDHHTHEHEHDHLHHQHQHQHDHSHDSKSWMEDGKHSHSHEHSNFKIGFHRHEHNRSLSPSIGPLRSFKEIKEMLELCEEQYIPKWASETAIKVFLELAKAEASAHGVENINSVHFHEVGAVDSIVDTVGTLIGLNKLGVSSFSCTPLPMGEGTVWTQHGLLPVPAPATLHLMIGMKTCRGPPGKTGELVTPTGASLLRVLTQSGKELPGGFIVRSVGIGAGSKNFEKHPNILRLLLGDLG